MKTVLHKLAMLLSVAGLFGGASMFYANGPALASQDRDIFPLVCFFTEVDFAGQYFCEIGSRTVNWVDPIWSDSVKSINVTDGASVKICSDYGRTGDCVDVIFDWPELPAGLFNHVYSYRTDGGDW